MTGCGLPGSIPVSLRLELAGIALSELNEGLTLRLLRVLSLRYNLKPVAQKVPTSQLGLCF